MKVSYIAVLAAGTALAAGSASANHVDFFSDGAFDVMGEGIYTQSNNPGNTLGGMRTLTITGNGGTSAELAGVPDGPAAIAGPSDATVELMNTGQNSSFQFDYAFMADFIDIPDSDETWDAAQIEIVDYMSGGGIDDSSVTVSVSDADSTASQMVSFGSSGNLIFDYDDFDGVDFSAVTGFSALFETQPSVSLSLGGITRQNTMTDMAPAPIPLPAGLPLALGAFGLMGWVARKRRG